MSHSDDNLVRILVVSQRRVLNKFGCQVSPAWENHQGFSKDNNFWSRDLIRSRVCFCERRAHVASHIKRRTMIGQNLPVIMTSPEPLSYYQLLADVIAVSLSTPSPTAPPPIMTGS
ncbi:hypothetical protein J6590_060984 [Homalodisca vitripennis]|nr:hypothetical protein J6590_060984 [Homalodisca vitripennis]